MIEGYNPVLQAFIGTLFTWGLTAAGAAVVFFVHGSKRTFLDGSLGFAAGVMTAASFWSLLEPAVQMAEESKLYGKFSCLPVGFGFLLGALFVYGVDILITKLGVHSPNMMLALHTSKNRREKQGNESGNIHEYESETTAIDVFNEYGNNIHLRTRGDP